MNPQAARVGDADVAADPPVDGRRARAERNRDAVVEAILELLSSGVERPTINEIAEHSGVSVRSVFRHFDDVESLYLAAITRQWERVGPLFAFAVPDAAAPQRIAALVEQRARLFEEISNVRRCAERLAPTSPAITRNLQESRKILRREVAECFEAELAARPSSERDDLLDALELVASWPAWSTWRGDQRLPVARAKRVMTLGLRALLGDAMAPDDPVEDDLDPVGVGPHPEPWPDDPRLDPALLADGDRRNVVDRYRYWRNEAIVDDLDRRRHPFHVAIENWQHDFNIGAVVRNANAFLAAAVHLVGRRRWNRRGAMVTDRYQHLVHHPTVDDLVGWAAAADLPLIGIDNLPGSVALETLVLPERCVLVFGQEGPGLSPAMRDAAEVVASIRQFGSTRSINAGVASGIAMHEWVRQHAVTR